MFSFKKIWIGILTLIVIAVTFCISRLVTDCFDGGYWYTVCGIIFGELQLGLVMMAVLKSEDKSMPLLSGNVLVGVAYFVFSLLAILFVNCPPNVLLIVHIVALVLMLILHVVFCLAHTSVTENAKIQDAAQQTKQDFQIRLESFRQLRSDWLAENSVLKQKILSLLDDARFAPESVAGSDEVDARVNAKIDSLCEAASAEDAIRCADALKAEFVFRKEKIKTLR